MNHRGARPAPGGLQGGPPPQPMLGVPARGAAPAGGPRPRAGQLGARLARAAEGRSEPARAGGGGGAGRPADNREEAPARAAPPQPCKSGPGLRPRQPPPPQRSPRSPRLTPAGPPASPCPAPRPPSTAGSALPRAARLPARAGPGSGSPPPRAARSPAALGSGPARAEGGSAAPSGPFPLGAPLLRAQARPAARARAAPSGPAPAARPAGLSPGNPCGLLPGCREPLELVGSPCSPHVRQHRLGGSHPGL
uniref:proline-rich protein 2-like n=1 Tax=Nyctereutes procyonoides TaxID=34880 RepID=UPI002443CF5C|nr:proline-rich protein 2-like [Nyctereutes procyonoides]